MLLSFLFLFSSAIANRALWYAVVDHPWRPSSAPESYPSPSTPRVATTAGCRPILISGARHLFCFLEPSFLLCFLQLSRVSNCFDSKRDRVRNNGCVVQIEFGCNEGKIISRWVSEREREGYASCYPTHPPFVVAIRFGFDRRLRNGKKTRHVGSPPPSVASPTMKRDSLPDPNVKVCSPSPRLWIVVAVPFEGDDPVGQMLSCRRILMLFLFLLVDCFLFPFTPNVVRFCWFFDIMGKNVNPDPQACSGEVCQGDHFQFWW